MDSFSPAAAASLPDGDARAEAAVAASEVGLPSTETEEWRYSLVGELPVDQLRPVVDAPDGAPATLDRTGAFGGDRAATVVVIDGWVVEIDLAPGWAEKGLEITSRRATAAERRATDDADPTAFDLLHEAFAPAAVTIRVPRGLAVSDPVVVISHSSGGGGASFPHVVVEAGEGSDVAVVERRTSAPGPGLSVPVVDLSAASAANLRYQLLQEHDAAHWELARLRTSGGDQSTVAVGVGAFGARYARLRADGVLAGRGATATIAAAYFGDGEQVHDFRVFQHHDAPDTRSDLLFKGAQAERSGSIYTGLIHIHPDGARTNAFQTNRNVKLGTEAWAWSVPNLEIENNDVHCSHASTVSPVDGDQQFYLQSRGVPPGTADRLIVTGFFDEVIGRLPVAGIRDHVRANVARKLDREVLS